MALLSSALPPPTCCQPACLPACLAAPQVPQLAQEVLNLFKPFLLAGSVYRVLETIFAFLDQKGRWQKADLVKVHNARPTAC